MIERTACGLICGIAVVLAASGVARANRCVWTGSGSGNGKNIQFSRTSNWSCDTGSATTTTDYVFDHSLTLGGNQGSNGKCTFDANITANSITIQGTYNATITGNAAGVSLTINGAWTQSAAVFTSNGGNMTVGSLSLSTGVSFTATTGTLQVGGTSIATLGSFSAAAGTFVTGTTGTVVLAGTANNLQMTSGGNSFVTLTVNGSGGVYTLQDALLTVSGNLTISAGTVALNGKAISVGGNWSSASSTSLSGTGTVTLTGTTAAETIASGGASFNALTINGSGGTYTLQDNLATTGDLTLSAGTLATGSNNIQVGGSFNTAGGAFSGGAGTVSVTSALALTSGTYSGGSGSATAASVNVSATVTNGGDPTLVGYWTLDDASSPSLDSSASNNSLIWSGGPTASPSHPTVNFTDNGSLSMTGAQAATTSGALSGIAALRPTTVTVSAWYKASTVDTNGSEIASGSNTYGLRITTSGLTVMKRITDNTSAADWIEYRVPETTHLDGNWHQIVGVIAPGAGSMTAYFDGTPAAGTYWINGSNGAFQLSSTTSTSAPITATTAAADPIDWDANTETFGFVIGNNPSTTHYQFGAGTGCTTAGTCAIDDVRVYNRALSATDVAALSHGSQPTGTSGVLTLAGAMTVTGAVTVQSTGTLALGSGSLAVGTTLIMDGTLISSGGTIKATSSRYTFEVGSTSTAAPILNIDGLAVQGTDSNGMWINAASGASTTFTEFDKVAFSNGTGNQLLNISASSLYLTSSGCTFDGSTTYAVAMTAVGASNPRALFGDATCATNTNGICANSEKQDSDANNDGVPDSGNGAVVEFIRAAETDTKGTIVGYPTAAFNWNNFSYYSTYVAFHDATSTGSDAIYMRDANGNGVYTWSDPNLMSTNESIVGTPVWTSSLSGTHYLYVAVNGGSANAGGVYRLIDDGTTLTPDKTWPTSTKVGYFPCTCTITSDVQIDANNVYWAGTNSGGQKLFGIVQSSGASLNTTYWPRPAPANVTTSAPSLVTSASMLYLGVTGMLARIDLTSATYAWTQDGPVTAASLAMGTVTGRVSYGTNFSSTSRVYAGDASGNMWAVDPTAFSGTNYLWSYAAGSAVTDNYYDAATDTVQFGTSAGKVLVLTGAGNSSTKVGVTLNGGYPYTLPNSDSVATAPLYYNGVLVVGSTKGNLYFLDRNTGPTPPSPDTPNSVAIIKEVNFGSSESVSTIGFDANSSRFMVSTSSAANDGRLYYFDLITDPTSNAQ